MVVEAIARIPVERNKVISKKDFLIDLYIVINWYYDKKLVANSLHFKTGYPLKNAKNN